MYSYPYQSMLSFKDFFLKHKWEILGLFLLLGVVAVNRFPDGYVIAGEDTFQQINLQEYYRFLFYDWQGRASLFYGIFYLLDRLHISETAQLSWYLGIFLIGSYLSFIGFTRLVFGKINSAIAVSGALFYALNLYTLYIFTYSWGYSHFQILYVFIPVLTGTYIVFLRSWRVSSAAFFLLFLFLASSGFANPAFAVSLFIFLLLLTFFLTLAHLVSISKKTLSYLIVLGLFSFLVSAYWMLPLLPQISKGVSDLVTTNSIDLGWWLQKTSNPISETLRLGQFNSGSFFPNNNPYTDFDFIKPLILILSFLPIIIILAGIWYGEMREPRHRRFFWGFSALLVTFVLLNARVRYPFDGLNNLIFHLPGLNTLRGYEKIAIFTPFLLSVLLTLTLMRSWTVRWRQVMITAMVLILLLPLPFYVGKLQQNMSFIFAQRSKDFRKSSHSFLVKIPRPYYDIRATINNDADEFKIASLPYNTDKLGWASYPEWKMRGNDITAALYKAPLISPNSPSIGQWLFAKDFNEQENDPLWIVELLGILNTKYILYHKDVHDEFIQQSQEKILYLKSLGALLEAADNEYFTLYRIQEEYVAPYIYTDSQQNSLKNYSIQNILENGKKMRATWRGINYEKIHSKKMIVSLPDDLGGKNLVLNERYDPLWRAVYQSDGEHVVLKRDNSVTYANVWRIDATLKNGSVIIEYLPMKLFFIGAWTSGGALSLVIISLIHTYAQRRKKV